jgi:hypothetical protein
MINVEYTPSDGHKWHVHWFPSGSDGGNHGFVIWFPWGRCLKVYWPSIR